MPSCRRPAAWLFAVASVAFVGFSAPTIDPASAHGAASWIMDNAMIDPVTKESCCGAQDCEMVPATGVRIVEGGYLIYETGETIPESRAQDSKDGHFWRCRYLTGIDTGKTRCFFRGLPGM